jgi:hypothetical protein
VAEGKNQGKEKPRDKSGPNSAKRKTRKKVNKVGKTRKKQKTGQTQTCSFCSLKLTAAEVNDAGLERYLPLSAAVLIRGAAGAWFRACISAASSSQSVAGVHGGGGGAVIKCGRIVADVGCRDCGAGSCGCE